MKDDRISLRLFYIDYERYKLKQNPYNDKYYCIVFYFNEISEIQMN